VALPYSTKGMDIGLLPRSEGGATWSVAVSAAAATVDLTGLKNGARIAVGADVPLFLLSGKTAIIAGAIDRTATGQGPTVAGIVPVNTGVYVFVLEKGVDNFLGLQAASAGTARIWVQDPGSST
jgi:hypothetical protein